MISSTKCIGDKVRVTGYVKFYYADRYRMFEVTPEEFEGYITGASNRPIGKYISASGGQWDDYEPAYLRVTSTVKVYHVRKRLYGREYLVLPENIYEHSDTLDKGDGTGRTAQEQGGNVLCDDGSRHGDHGQG